MHRDLKPENLILKDSNNYTDFAIADFGLAEFYRLDVEYLEKCGTIGYIAPEVLRNEPYNQKIDIFSIGVILYSLFTGIVRYKINFFLKLVKFYLSNAQVLTIDSFWLFDKQNFGKYCNPFKDCSIGLGIYQLGLQQVISTNKFGKIQKLFLPIEQTTIQKAKNQFELHNTLPFDGNSTLEVYENNMQANINMQWLNQINVTDKAKQFVISLLSGNPEKRPTAKEALKHEWFLLPPSLTNNLIISTLSNLSLRKKQQKFLSIKCIIQYNSFTNTSPLWNKSKIKEYTSRDQNDVQNKDQFWDNMDIIIQEDDDLEIADDQDCKVNLIVLSAQSCEKYYFSNSKIRLLNEKREQGLL